MMLLVGVGGGILFLVYLGLFVFGVWVVGECFVR